MNAEKMLERLVEKGKITKEDIDEVRRDSPELVSLLSTIHSLFCQADHDSDECMFPQETQLPDGYEKPFQEAWREYTTRFMDIFGLSVDDLKTSLAEYLELKLNVSTRALIVAEAIGFENINEDLFLHLLSDVPVEQQPFSLHVLEHDSESDQ